MKETYYTSLQILGRLGGVVGADAMSLIVVCLEVGLHYVVIRPSVLSNWEYCLMSLVDELKNCMIDAIAAALRASEDEDTDMACPFCGDNVKICNRRADHDKPLCPEWARCIEEWDW